MAAKAQSLPADLSLSNVNAGSGAAAYQATNSITADTVTVNGSASVQPYAGDHIKSQARISRDRWDRGGDLSRCHHRAMLLSPAPGTSLPGASQTFSWSAGGAGVTGYWLQMGNSPGAQDIYGGVTTSLSQTVLNLPTDGRTIYARLWTQVDGVWSSYVDYTFAAAQASPNQVPAYVSVAPQIGSGFGTTFAGTYADPNGASDIRWAYFVAADPGAFGSSCYAMYDAQEKLLYLLNTDGVTFQPAIHAGQNETRSTSRCTLSGLGAGDDVNSTFLPCVFRKPTVRDGRDTRSWPLVCGTKAGWGRTGGYWATTR